MFHGNVEKRIATGLKVLDQRITGSSIPSSKIDETLNIATWNIREFGKKRRSEAAVHYMAEIIGQFDLVSIVELREDLTDLSRVLDILGPYWRTVYSDMIPDAGGNYERLAFVYDKRAAVFNGLAAEANPPRKKFGTEYQTSFSWWRNPYMASFRSGNFDFVILTAHIRWGSSEPAREQELRLLAEWVDAKHTERNCEDKDLIVLGDFNIPEEKGPLFEAITSKGLVIPKALRKRAFGSNLAKDKRYDQILIYPQYPDNFSDKGGVLDFYGGDHQALFPGMSLLDFTFQISDHLPLWLQVNTDIESHRLDEIIRG